MRLSDYTSKGFLKFAITISLLASVVGIIALFSTFHGRAPRVMPGSVFAMFALAALFICLVFVGWFTGLKHTIQTGDQIRNLNLGSFYALMLAVAAALAELGAAIGLKTPVAITIVAIEASIILLAFQSTLSAEMQQISEERRAKLRRGIWLTVAATAVGVLLLLGAMGGTIGSVVWFLMIYVSWRVIIHPYASEARARRNGMTTWRFITT